MSQELEVRQPGGDLQVSDERAAELARKATGNIDRRDLVLPMVSLTQQLSRAVTEGDAQAGVFLNGLTGEDLGDELDIIVVKQFYGRFYSDEDNNSFSAVSEIVPPHWPEQWAGQRFDELAEAEEQYRERVNREEIEWGKGPQISTTHNYIAFKPGENLPFRLSLMRTNVPAARKINTMIDFAAAPWDHVIRLDAERRENAGRPFFVVKATQGRQTDAEERQAAIRLADLIDRSEVTFAGEEVQAEARAAAPAPADALDV